MVLIATLQEQFQNSELQSSEGKILEYEIGAPINLYDSPELKALATQAIAHRHLRFTEALRSLDLQTSQALPVILCEDDYPGWVAIADLNVLRLTHQPYIATPMSPTMVQAKIPAAIAFAQAAMAEPNEYLWGGTLGPNLDCSGLVQRAFGSQGIWLPRDAYQQEAFADPIPNPGQEPSDLLVVLQTGDLIFFGPPAKATHVAIYLGDGAYIHSSGKAQGRNGIGIDRLSDRNHPVSQIYYEQVRGAGRVTQSYCASYYASYCTSYCATTGNA